MNYDGKIWSVNLDSEGICELKIDTKDSGANVMNAQAIGDLKEAIKCIQGLSGVKGLMLTSGKEHFIFGADITEFIGHFKKSKQELQDWLWDINSEFNKIEDLPYPTIAAINGFALGGGLEVCLLADMRIANEGAKIGVPETKLGLIPGWGGTVRLSRICGADNAIEWVALGKQWRMDAAYKVGAVDAVVGKDVDLNKAARIMLTRMINEELDWQGARLRKTSPLKLNKTEAGMTFKAGEAFVASQAGPAYPAPVNGVKAIAEGAMLTRDEALKKEAFYFAESAKTPTASSLVRVFLGDQFLKKKSKKITKRVDKIKYGAVLGAGIMGGGIAYQSASTGTPVLMKDINQAGLTAGLGEASKLLGKLHKRGRIDATKMNMVMGAITPTLSYGDFAHTDFVVEAVIENLDIKKKVLAEVEQKVNGAVIASNTSTIPIDDMAVALKDPSKFCGLHFFNPVHKMPLVEIIRGAKTSDETIARAVMYATQMKKTPIVVNDCSGFLVNRVLFPYFLGLVKLIEDGVDFRVIDKQMEKFGWPMGPAYLLDVVGIDTADHCTHTIGKAYGDRMVFGETNIINELYQTKRFGQKNGVGFYKYAPDRRGRIKKSYDESIETIISKCSKGKSSVEPEEIMERMMLPMMFEGVRCLEDKIVESPVEVDMGVLLGLGFPPSKAGLCKFMDDVGMEKLIEKAKKYSHLGPAYEVPQMILDMKNENKKFYEGV